MRCKICEYVVRHANPESRKRRVCGKCVRIIKKILSNSQLVLIHG